MTIEHPEPLPLHLPSLAWNRHVLPNGLTLVVHEDRRESRVHVGMNYHVGSKDETVGVNTGFAHLFEHLMFGGTERLPGPYVDRLKQAGALDVNGMTGHDSTRFYQLIHTGMLEFTLYAEADRMAHVGTQLRQAVLDQQREIVLMEKRQREGEPLGRVPECVSRGLFPAGHPYRHTVIGETADLRAATLAAARDWSKRYYAPSNAVLVLVGDVGFDEALAMVERQFGHIPPGPPMFRPGLWMAPSAGPRRDRLEDPLVSDPLLRFTWVSANAKDPRSSLISFAVRLLNEGRPSPLARALVHEGGSVLDVSASESSEMACGQVSVTLRLAADADAAAVERDFRSALAQLLSRPFETAQLDQMRANQLRALTQACTVLPGKVQVLTSGEMEHGDPGAFEQIARRWLQMSVGELHAEALRCLGAEPYVLHVLPRSHAAFLSGAAGPDNAPAVAATSTEPPTLDAKSFKVGPLVPMWHLPGPDPARLALQLVLRRGLVDLPPAERYLAVLLNALPNLGLGGREVEAQAAWLAASELRVDCSSDGGHFNVRIDGPARAAGCAIELLAGITGWSGADPAMQAAPFAFERRQASLQWAARRADPVARAASLPQDELLGEGHPMRTAPGQVVNTLEHATLNDLRALHRKLFDPRLAELVLVGGGNVDSFRLQLDRTWAPWTAPGGAPLERAAAPRVAPRSPAPAPIGVVEAGQAGQAHLFGACLLPGFDPNEGWALQALVHILGGGMTSRLSRRLRDGLNLTYNVRAMLNETGRPDVPRVLTISSAMDPARAGEGLLEMQRVLSGLCREDLPSAEEVEAFQRSAALRLPSFSSEPGEVCGALAFQSIREVDGSYWRSRAQALQRLAPADVQAMARALLQNERFRWAFAGDARGLGEQLAAHGFRAQVHAIAGPAIEPAADRADKSSALTP